MARKRRFWLFFYLFLPDKEPQQADYGGTDADGIADVVVEGESLGGYADIAGAYKQHE